MRAKIQRRIYKRRRKLPTKANPFRAGKVMIGMKGITQSVWIFVPELKALPDGKWEVGENDHYPKGTILPHHEGYQL